jgi:hypothetical protein
MSIVRRISADQALSGGFFCWARSQFSRQISSMCPRLLRSTSGQPSNRRGPQPCPPSNILDHTYSPGVRAGHTAGPFTGSWDGIYSCHEQFRGGTVRRRPIDLSTESGALRLSNPMKWRTTRQRARARVLGIILTGNARDFQQAAEFRPSQWKTLPDVI